MAELAPWFPEGAPVGALGLDTATDREMWTDAGEQGCLIVSKDSDFRQLAFLLAPPPRGCGAIAELLRSGADAIARFAGSEEEALLVLPDLDR